ncbi:tetratricopeptide repeat protein [Pigmentiphaga aceris]|uniref:tetratricopeptide repeat protein n=1 Tax=Pigmentiphaga aceris TaxID=1940612 RepID=UPI001CA330FD|nr:tetratricopeptide repeat protein [Pigmentiphaga aceris]
MVDFPSFSAAPPPDSDQAAVLLLPDDAKLLTEIGFLAAASGDVSRAERIFNGLARLRPGRAYPSVGLAVAWMNAGRAADAVVLLEKAQTSDPEERATLDAWRGFALQLAGRISESRRVLDTLAAKDGDAGVLARGLLGLAQEGK